MTVQHGSEYGRTFLRTCGQNLYIQTCEVNTILTCLPLNGANISGTTYNVHVCTASNPQCR